MKQLPTKKELEKKVEKYHDRWNYNNLPLIIGIVGTISTSIACDVCSPKKPEVINHYENAETSIMRLESEVDRTLRLATELPYKPEGFNSKNLAPNFDGISQTMELIENEMQNIEEDEDYKNYNKKSEEHKRLRKNVILPFLTLGGFGFLSTLFYQIKESITINKIKRKQYTLENTK